MFIKVLHDTETLQYAAKELKKYLAMMDGDFPVEIGEGEGISLGYLSDFGLSEHGVKDPLLDDVIDVQIEGMRGFIAGSNDRSVLMGVYDLLKSLGCRFLRPGPMGDYVPKVKVAGHSFSYRHEADRRFRGQCLEGTISCEHVVEMILYLPKIHMNMFMTEQIVPYNYMHHWYEHTMNPYMEKEPFSYEMGYEMVLKMEKAVKLCGLQLHALGHGYITEPFGIRADYQKNPQPYPDGAMEAFALVNGKRELYRGSPFFTQPCLSREWVRKRLVEWLVDYMKEKPYIDFLHVWLADSFNNQCECEGCVKMTPSDFYVVLLNELDEALSAAGIDTKIVFIMYVDTMFPPEKTHFKNPDRFVLITALNKPHGKLFEPQKAFKPLPKYQRNNYGFAKDLTPYDYMHAWEEFFKGPKLVYEYYLFSNHYGDPGYDATARWLVNDARAVSSVGFEGIMSDQTMRASFPNGMPLAALGETLFDVNIDEEAFFEDYYRSAYGKEWRVAREYLTKLSYAFDPGKANAIDIALADTGADTDKTSFEDEKKNASVCLLEQAKATADEYAPKIRAIYEAEENACHKASWKLLTHHVPYAKNYADIKLLIAKDLRDEARAKVMEVMDGLYKAEPEIHREMDPYVFYRGWDGPLFREVRVKAREEAARKAAALNGQSPTTSAS